MLGQTLRPVRKSNGPGNKSLRQLVGAAKAVLDFYGPAVEDSAVEAKERKLFHRGTGTVL